MYADCNHHIYIMLGNVQTKNMTLADYIYFEKDIFLVLAKVLSHTVYLI